LNVTYFKKKKKKKKKKPPENLLPKVLFSLCSGDPIKNLESKQSTTKQFAELLHFVLLFDDLKVGFFFIYFFGIEINN